MSRFMSHHLILSKTFKKLYQIFLKMAEAVLFVLIVGAAAVGPVALPMISIKIQNKIKKINKKRKAKKYFKKIKKIKNDERCVICQEDLKKKDKCVELHCNHQFHKHCIKKWICVKESCPLCNTKLKRE
jgi:hypothetical protein